MKKIKKNSQKGFTLVELLVVIAIIGILAVIAVPALFKNINKSKVADVESDYSAFKSAVLSYYTEKNELPADIKKLEGYMDTVPDKAAVGGDYAVIPTGAEKVTLTISGAKLTKEQSDKLTEDIGKNKVKITGDKVEMVLIESTGGAVEK